MIKIKRHLIDILKGDLMSAIRAATSPAGVQITIPMPSDESLEKAAMLALQSLTMDTLNVREISVPSDVQHVVNFKEVFA